MKRFIFVPLIGLTACLETGENTVEMKGSETCDPAAFEFLIGQQEESMPGILTPDELRVLKPNSVMTMDHNPERLNVFLDDGGTINKVTCG
ncbi:I78 family peptidase inhibitor [Shimia thalassica]|uniref:I78 family peptidase inhibitor n=1 Tax=Shimia thalassica TaxID=1715693 RepID=UPI001C08CEA7|nr:I78 family peptidase inhibitor [Shimia thalassica]MBU2943401.1 hypothetical protein [Shimia thalassica]MDO6501470.1 I78 family peptidase inhibitor [Shimia thalassica]